LCTTNSTRPDVGLNSGRRSGKPATNRLIYGTAYDRVTLVSLQLLGSRNSDLSTE
jgi:hypothetical protein